jgi:hypothetical protein
MVQHADPVKLVCDSTGVLGCLYLSWRGRTVPAMTALFGSSVLGSLLVRNADVDQLAATELGHWMLGQAQPVNLVVRSAGLTVLLVGTRRHALGTTVGGLAMIAAARPLSRRMRLSGRQ